MSASANSSSSDSESSASAQAGLQEWSKCRDTISSFDALLDALRKQGFTFVSALLSSTAVIATVSGTVVTPMARAAILMVTIGLIVVLAVLEKYYREVLRAASVRASILEQQLNLGESRTITFYYNQAHLWFSDLELSVGFVGLTWLLGLAILDPALSLSAFALAPMFSITVAAVVASVMIVLAGRTIYDEGVDISVDRLNATVGDPVLILITNMFQRREHPQEDKDKPWQLTVNATVSPVKTLSGLAIKNDGKEAVPDQQKAVPDQQSATWKEELLYFDGFCKEWDTSGLKPGIYRWDFSWSVESDPRQGKRKQPASYSLFIQLLAKPPTPPDTLPSAISLFR